jgi:hypothetical protein
MSLMVGEPTRMFVAQSRAFQLMVSGPDDEHVVTVLRAATAMVDNAVELLGTAKVLMRDLIGDNKPTGTEA